MLKFRFIHRAGSLQQIPTVSTLDIQRPPGYVIVLKLYEGREDGTAAATGVGRAKGSKVCCYNRWQ